MTVTKRPPGSANGGTVLALLALLLIAAGLLALTAMILGRFAFGILAVLFGLFSFGAMHYLLWGWWLNPKVDDDSDEEGGE
ncbi:MAG: hypothetical protein ACE5KM_07425 [Planctomycetaceae bacterium]